MTDFASTGRVGTPAGKDFLAFDVGSGLPVTRIEETIPLVANNAAGQVANWSNPFPFPVAVEGFTVYAQTASAGACTVSGGVAANAQTLSNGILSGQSVAATGRFNGTIPATIAGSTVGVGQAVTLSVASGASAGLTGWLRLSLMPLGIVRNS